MIIRICLLILLATRLIQAQPEDQELVANKDTSFTVFSSLIKEREKFPFIKIADGDLHENILIDSNVVYVSYGKRKLRLDIVYPKNSMQKHPAVMLVHGGGWSSGDKFQQIPMAKVLASKGFVAASIEYRLSPEAKYPAAIYDLKLAVRWLRANSEHYRIDSSKIAVLGCSSGGHLASILGVTNGNPKFEDNINYPDISSDVQAVINIDGILDFTDPAESGKDNDPEKPSVGKLWLGYTYLENPQIWREASPINYVNCLAPPFLFLNSSIDRFHAGRDSLIKILNDCKTYSEIHTFPDTPHTFWLFHPWFNAVNKIVIDFLDKIFAVRE